MKWTKTSSVIPNQGGGKVRIKTKLGEMGLTELEQEQVGHTVGTAREILQTVISQLNWPSNLDPRLKAHMALYFKTANAGPTWTQMIAIKRKLVLTMNGISSKVNVKVAPDEAYGYVGFKKGVKGVMRGLFSSRHNLGTRNGELVSRGDIHIDRDVLGGELAVITFIHEATHKYADTVDHGDSGYVDNSGSDFDAPGLTTAQALNNADSYAWFCFAAYYR